MIQGYRLADVVFSIPDHISCNKECYAQGTRPSQKDNAPVTSSAAIVSANPPPGNDDE